MRATAFRLSLAVALAVPVLAQDAQRVAGRVIDPAGKGVAGATVTVVDVPWDWQPGAAPETRLPDRILATATCDDTGSFALDASLVPKGLHPLRVDVPGRASLLRDSERIAFGAGALPWDLAIVTLPSAVIEGMALDAIGAPVAGARLTIVATSLQGAGVVSSRTGGDGRFRIDGLPGDSHVIVSAESDDAGSAHASATLPFTGSVRVALHLAPSREVAGVVVSREGEQRPVAAARVVVLGTSRAASPLEVALGLVDPLGERYIATDALTGPDGAFSVRVPAGAQAWLVQPGLAPRPLVPGRNIAQRRAPVTGMVVDADGRPVAGARVQPFAQPLATLTDATGRFALVATRDDRVRVTAPSGAGTVATVREEGTRVKLPRARALSGLVVTTPTEAAPDGVPIAGAIVRACMGDEWDAMTSTDAAGQFTLALPGAPTRVTVVGAGRSATLALAGLDLARPVRLVAAEAASVVARVTLKGMPAKAATAVVRGEDCPRDARVAETNEGGVASLTGLAPGNVGVVAHSNGLRAESAPGAAQGGARARSVGLALSAPAQLKVRCLDGERKPLEGVAVSARAVRVLQDSGRPLEGGALARRRAFLQSIRGSDEFAAGTGPDGVAIIEGVTLGECLNVVVRRPGLAPVEVDCARAGEGAGTIDVTLERGAIVRGVVLDPDGLPIPSARVSVRADSSTASASATGMRGRRLQRFSGLAATTTDGAGAFTLADLKPGRIEIVANAERFVPSEPVPVDLVPGSDIAIEIPLERGAALEGVVVTAAGEPAAGASVIVSPPAMTRFVGRSGRAWQGGPGGMLAQGSAVEAGPDGRFVIEGLEPDSEIGVQARLDGDESERRVLVPGDEPVTLTLVAMGRIEGRVLGGEDMAAAVTITCTGAPAGRGSESADAEGGFFIGGLPGGTYSCVAVAGDLGEGRTDNLVVREGETTPATIRLGPRTRQAVLVRDDASRDPVAGASVHCGSASGVTDGEGRALVSMPPAGAAQAGGTRIRAEAQGFAPADVLVPTPPPAVLELRLQGSASILGVVVDSDGAAVAGIDVRTAGASAISDPAGRFELTLGRTSPRITLTAERSRDGIIERGTLDVELAAQGEVTLRLERLATGSVLVAVVDDAGPVTKAQVSIVHDASPMRHDMQDARFAFAPGEGLGTSGVTDEAGSFLAEGLRPGGASILAARDGEALLRAAGTVQIQAAAQAQATVRIPGGAMIDGSIVRGAEGVEGVMVLAFPMTSAGRADGPPLAMIASGAGGAFRLGPFPGNITRVRVQTVPGPSGGDRSAEAEAVPGGPEIVLDVQGSIFTGSVTADGEPAGGVEVVAQATGGGSRRSVRTGPDGSFEIGGLDPGEAYGVTATLAGHAPAATTAIAPPAGVLSIGSLELGAGELSGMATAAGQRPPDRFALFLVSAAGSRLPRIDVDVAADGTWHADAPSAEPLAYRAAARGFGSIHGVTVPGEPLALTFPPGAELTIEVVEADGRPAPGASARVISWNGLPADDHLVPTSPAPSSRGPWGRSDENGRLVLFPMTAGTTVLAIDREGREAQATVTLQDGDRLGITVRLPVR